MDIPQLGHLVYFHFLTLMNSTAMNICVQVFMWMYVLISVECIPGNEIAGSYANCLAF